MKIQVLNMLMVLMVLITSCQNKDLEKDIDNNAENILSNLKVGFNLDYSKFDVVDIDVKSNNITVIKDINIYMYNKSLHKMYSSYFTNLSNISFEIVRGDYDIYAIANYGKDLGNLTYDEIKNFQIKKNSNNEINQNLNNIYSANISQNITEIVDIQLRLKNIISKVSVKVNTNLDDEIILKSIQMMSAPLSCSLYSDNNQESDFTNYDEVQLTENEDVVFYVMENLQGINVNIKNEKEKHYSNAPENATYLLIKAENSTKELEYRVFLGENNTSSFNVFRNNDVRYNIDINGVDELDLRTTIIVKAQDINVMLTEVETKINSHKDPNGDISMDEEYLKVTVVLDKASSHSLQIILGGSMLTEWMEGQFSSSSANYIVTISAGSKEGTKSFFSLQRMEGDPKPTGEDIYIKSINKNTEDPNTYTDKTSNVNYY